MSKLIEKTVSKTKLISLILAVVVALGVVIAAVFGFNSSLISSDKQLLTVEMNRVTYKNDKEEIETLCEDNFETAGVCYLQKLDTKLSGDEGKIVYVFEKDADLTAVKSGIESAATAENGLVVSVNESSVLSNVTDGYYVRNGIALAVFAVFALVYVSLRYKLSMGITMAATLVASAGLTTALAAFTRIPVNYSFVYVLAVALFVTVIATLLTFNKIRENAKLDAYQEMDAKQAVVSSVAVKETLTFGGVAVGALVVLGGLTAAFGVWNIVWFAILSLLAVVCSIAVSLLFAPALYSSLQKRVDKKAAERARYDYKKPAKKEETKDEQSA